MLANMMRQRKGESMPWGPAWGRPARRIWLGGLEKVEAWLWQGDRHFPAAEGS